MKSIININGELLSEDKAKVSVFDRGFLYGDSVYEVTQTFKKKLFLFDEHMDRLWNSANMMDMLITYSRDEIEYEVEKVVNALDFENIYIRIVITRGEGEISLDPAMATKNNLIVIGKELPPNPTWWYEKGVHMIVAHIVRNPKNATDPNIKSGNYLNNVMAMNEAKKKGAFDAIMLNSEGFVTECTTSNLWIIKDNKAITPPVKSGLLSGITRKKLLEVCRENSIEALEKNITEDELKDADECFLTSTTKQIVPITNIDSIEIGTGKPGPLTQKLLKLYQKSQGIM